eukprot:scaffold7925_cov229-Pinguiococcus_pyrenoidosus.AAC.1
MVARVEHSQRLPHLQVLVQDWRVQQDGNSGTRTELLDNHVGRDGTPHMKGHEIGLPPGNLRHVLRIGDFGKHVRQRLVVSSIPPPPASGPLPRHRRLVAAERSQSARDKVRVLLKLLLLRIARVVAASDGDVRREDARRQHEHPGRKPVRLDEEARQQRGDCRAR